MLFGVSALLFFLGFLLAHPLDLAVVLHQHMAELAVVLSPAPLDTQLGGRVPQAKIIHKLHGDKSAAEGQVEDIVSVLVLGGEDSMHCAEFLKHAA